MKNGTVMFVTLLFNKRIQLENPQFIEDWANTLDVMGLGAFYGQGLK